MWSFFFNYLIDNFVYVICSIFSCISIFSGIMVISSKNPIHSIFYLIVSFLGVSGLMFSLNLEFLPIVFLVVYVGAVSVLFLFVVMMLNIKVIETSENFFNYLPVGFLIGFIFFIELYLFFLNPNVHFSFSLKDFDDKLLGFLSLLDYNPSFINNYLDVNSYNFLEEKNSLTDIEILSIVLYEYKFLAFILSSLILLVAMIGAIVLTLTTKRDYITVKRQDISEQVYRSIKLKIHNNK